jgi:hypothetical protein
MKINEKSKSDQKISVAVKLDNPSNLAEADAKRAAVNQTTALIKCKPTPSAAVKCDRRSAARHRRWSLSFCDRRDAL